MPTISWFYGIAIRMYVVDHPPAHFHAAYGEFEALVSVETGEVLEGRLPKRAAKLVAEWTSLHRAEMLANWEMARNGDLPERIAGLDADQGD